MPSRRKSADTVMQGSRLQWCNTIAGTERIRVSADHPSASNTSCVVCDARLEIALDLCLTNTSVVLRTPCVFIRLTATLSPSTLAIAGAANRHAAIAQLHSAIGLSAR